MNCHAGRAAQSDVSSAAGYTIPPPSLPASAVFSKAELSTQGLANADQNPSEKFPQERNACTFLGKL